MKKRESGFTLAEVLITLGIIGVVAAITIPTLINNYQKKENITRLKKAYTAVNQALKQMSLDRGCPNDLKCTGIFASPNTMSDVGDELVKYFSVARNCRTVANQGCWPTVTKTFYDGSGSTINYEGSSDYKFVTADGTAFDFYSSMSGCGLNSGSGAIGYMSQNCGLLDIDVNGKKGPNFFGIDTFEFFITNGKGALLYPLGGIDTTTPWKTAAGVQTRCYSENKDGVYCAGRIMEEGWEMNY